MCQGMVWAPGFWHQYPCTRKAVVPVGGKVFCRQHAKVEQRRLDREQQP